MTTKVDPEAPQTGALEIISPRELMAQSRSSGFGVSYHKQFFHCAFYGWLQEYERRQQQQPRPLAPEKPADETEEQPDDSHGYFGFVGVLFHKLAELYYTGALDKVAFEFAGAQDPPEWIEALRLFNYYRAKFPANEWTPKGAELPFRFESHPSFGVPVFTGRFDLPVRIEPAMLEQLRETRGIPLLSPGIYICDHKVKWRRSGVADKEWAYSPQMWLYMMAWDLLYPEDPCKGAIINVVYAYKQQKRDPTKGGPQAESFLIQPPRPEQRDAARNFLVQAEKRKNVLGYPANIEECFRFQGRVCHYHPSVGGPCDLIGEVK